MELLPHAPGCELAPPQHPKLHITLELRHRDSTHQSNALVVIDIYEQCQVCGQGVIYARSHLPIWRFERNWRSQLRTWWITYCHRNHLWDEVPLEGPEPPF